MDPAHPQFPHLFTPLGLRSVTLRNRVVMLPMGSRFAREGKPTEGDFAFYRARAAGGVGAIITGGTPGHPSGAMRNRGHYEPYIEDALPHLARLADTVHAEGAAIFGQLWHRGREITGDTDLPGWAPSAVPSPNDPQIPHAMSLAEVEDVVAAFGRSAANLRGAGFDGIEIHGAHGYLVAQFLSAGANRRTDRYGGAPENRMRFLLDLVDSIRAGIGPDAVLGVRMSADEGPDVPDGIRLPYSEAIARALAATGKVDYLSVTIGIRGAYVKDMSVPVGPAIKHAAAIRAAGALPVIAGQRINHPPLAERILADGNADLVGMARALITDADWVAKARDGRVEQIRPCIACLQVCRSGIMGCVHSPTAGRETLWAPGSLRRAERSRKVVVVGGGPAGMEAAIQAAERGHAVVLFEAERALGGQVRFAARAPHRTEIDGVVAHRVLELERLRVTVRLGRRADAAAVLAERPDAVVIATGAMPAAAEVEGADLPHVIDVLRALAPDAATESLLAGARAAVVVDDGSGFWESASAAEALAERGMRVALVTPAGAIAAGIPVESAALLVRRLRWRDVALVPMHRVSAIAPASVTVYDAVRVAATQILEEKTLPADVVVLYAGRTVVADLHAQLAAKVPELHMAGDCVSPRRINHAVLEGHRIGRAL